MYYLYDIEDEFVIKSSKKESELIKELKRYVQQDINDQFSGKFMILKNVKTFKVTSKFTPVTITIKEIK